MRHEHGKPPSVHWAEMIYAVSLAKSLELLHHCSEPVPEQPQHMTFARFHFYFYFSYSSPKAVEKR